MVELDNIMVELYDINYLVALHAIIFQEMGLFTILNGGSKLLIRVWSPFCSNWNCHQVCMGGVSVGITKMF